MRWLVLPMLVLLACQEPAPYEYRFIEPHGCEGCMEFHVPLVSGDTRSVLATGEPGFVIDGKLFARAEVVEWPFEEDPERTFFVLRLIPEDGVGRELDQWARGKVLAQILVSTEGRPVAFTDRGFISTGMTSGVFTTREAAEAVPLGLGIPSTFVPFDIKDVDQFKMAPAPD